MIIINKFWYVCVDVRDACMLIEKAIMACMHFRKRDEMMEKRRSGRKLGKHSSRSSLIFY